MTDPQLNNVFGNLKKTYAGETYAEELKIKDCVFLPLLEEDGLERRKKGSKNVSKFDLSQKIKDTAIFTCQH